MKSMLIAHEFSGLRATVTSSVKEGITCRRTDMNLFQDGRNFLWARESGDDAAG